MIILFSITLWELMRHFDGLGFATLFAGLQRVETAATILPTGSVNAETAATNLIPLFAEVEASCNELGLPIGAQKAKTSQDRVRSGCSTIEVGVECNGLAEIIRYELGAYIFMYIEPTRAALYTESNLFGQEVAETFPSSSFDIEEAGKCLALNRSTACVFHLMRVMEAGLYAIADNLVITNLQENWHNAIEQIESAVRSLPRSTPEEKDTVSFSFDAVAQLFNVKEAWRNRTAHSGHIYTEEKAQQIFDNVRGFMQILASRLSEKPL